MFLNNLKDDCEEDWEMFDELNEDIEESDSKLFANCSHSECIYDQRGSYEICTNCGLIMQERIIDSTPEWRSATNSQQFSSDPIRCSVINPLLPQSSLSTTISINGKANNSNYLLMTMNKWQSMPYSERSMFDVFSYLDEQCRYNVSKAIVHAAKIFYSKVYKKNIELSKSGIKREGLRGKKRKGLIAACLFYACKQNNEPRTKQEIANILDVPKSYVTKGCKIFLDLMKSSEHACAVTDIMNAKHFIEQFGKQLELDQKSIKYTMDLYNEMEKLDIFFGNQPPSIAAGIMFMMLKSLYPDISENYITDKCLITKVTITNVYRQLKNYEDILLFNVFAKDYYNKLGQKSNIILFKILTIGKYLLQHSEFYLESSDSPQLLAYAITYMVFFYSHINFDKQLLLKYITPYSERNLCNLMSKVLFYKTAIFESILKPVVYPKGIDIIHPLKKKKTNRFIHA